MTTVTVLQALDDVAIHEEPASGIRVRAGEEEMFDDGAFAAFAARQSKTKSVWRFARVFHVPVDVAADLTQNALLSLWRHRENVAASHWPGWFQKAMLRGVFTYSRTRRRAKKYEPAIAYEVYEGRPGSSPEIDLHAEQCERELLRLIDLLRPERRDVVTLYLLDELPMKEVAAKLGIPEDTAKNRWRLAQIDMARAFRRERAKERFLELVAAFVAFFAALWARAAARGPRRVGPLLACAALAMVVVSHVGEPSLVAGSHGGETAAASPAGSEEVAMVLPSLRFEHSFMPKTTAFAQREMERAEPPVHVDEARIEVALVLLAQAAAALRDDHPGVARAYLAQYNAAFPRDPAERFARQRAAIMAELASR